MKNKIMDIHIENDKRNGNPTLVFTDLHGIEWVHEEQTVSDQQGGFITALVRKSDSYYFKED